MSTNVRTLQPQAAMPPSDPSGRSTRNDAYAALGDVGEKHRQYLELLRSVTYHGTETQSGARIGDLTDMEAAEWLSWSRSSVNGRRDELMARNDRAVTERPVVVKSQRRRCNVTGSMCTAWKAAPHLL